MEMPSITSLSRSRPTTRCGHEALQKLLALPPATLFADHPKTKEILMRALAIPQPEAPIPTDVESFVRYRTSMIIAETSAQAAQTFAEQGEPRHVRVVGGRQHRFETVDVVYDQLVCDFRVCTSQIAGIQEDWTNALVLCHLLEQDGGPSDFELAASLADSNKHNAFLGYVVYAEKGVPEMFIKDNLPMWPTDDGGLPDVKDELSSVTLAVDYVGRSNGQTLAAPKVSITKKRMLLTFIGKLAQFNRYIRSVGLYGGDSGANQDPIAPHLQLYNRLIDPFGRPNCTFDSAGRDQSTLTAAMFNTLVGSSQDGYMLIIGGPGTGKTHTIAKMVVDRCNEDRNFRCLLTAPSNSAADVLYNCIAKLATNLHFIRIGEVMRFSEAVRRHNAEHWRKFINGKREQGVPFKVAEQLYITTARIVVSTLGSTQAQELVQNLDELRFTCWVVDEAGQANDAELFLPVIYPSLRHIVLIGDDAQLGPTVISPIIEGYPPDRLNYFSRLCKQLRHRSVANGLWTRLQPQRRMRPLVSGLVSLMSYRTTDDRLADASGAGSQTVALPALLVFSGASWNESHQVLSFVNHREAGFTVELLKAALLKAGYDTKKGSWPEGASKLSFAVISLYAAQVDLISGLIDSQLELRNSGVQISTVDAMQGSQADVVIVSCVRASTLGLDNGIGFARDLRRLNVAISRGACAYICASYATFRPYSGWTKLFEYAQLSNALLSAEDYQTGADLGALLTQKTQDQAGK